MNFTTLGLQRACRIALLAMLALVLAPTVSHALAAARGTAAWVEICTPQGALRVAVDEQGAGQEGPPAAATHFEHCGYCSLSTETPALPASAAACLPLPLASADPPALFLQIPRTPHAWLSAQPRAPPVPA